MKVHNVALWASVLAIGLSTAASAQKVTLKYLTAWDNRAKQTQVIAYQFNRNRTRFS